MNIFQEAVKNAYSTAQVRAAIVLDDASDHCKRQALHTRES